MSIEILNYLGVILFYVLLGIFGSTITGTLGCLIWCILIKRRTKFTVKYEMLYLRVIEACFMIPLVIAILLDIWKSIEMTSGEAEINMFMIKGMLIGVPLWIFCSLLVLGHHYKEYRAKIYLCEGYEPITDENILTIVDKWKSRLGIRQEVTLYYNDIVHSPAIMYYKGYRILLPLYPMSEEELNIALLHELVHLKQGDIHTKNVAFVVNAFHSFNPFTYYLRNQIEKWSEAGCDWQSCQVGKDEFSVEDYCKCILDLKERSLDASHTNIMYCLFENKNMLNFRIDLMMKRKDAVPHISGVIAAVVVLMLTMVVSVGISTNGLQFWKEKTLFYAQEEASEFDIISGNDIFANAKISYAEENIIDQMESEDVELESGEVIIYNVPERCGKSIITSVDCDNGTYQYGCIGENGGVEYLEETDTGQVVVPFTLEEPIRYFFVKNIGNTNCELEVYLISQQ